MMSTKRGQIMELSTRRTGYDYKDGIHVYYLEIVKNGFGTGRFVTIRSRHPIGIRSLDYIDFTIETDNSDV
jgi:hypothetical protein